jgi:hypothetical protein
VSTIYGSLDVNECGHAINQDDNVYDLSILPSYCAVAFGEWFLILGKIIVASLLWSRVIHIVLDTVTLNTRRTVLEDNNITQYHCVNLKYQHNVFIIVIISPVYI